MSDKEFKLTPSEPKERVVAKEPLYSMLMECKPAALKYLYDNLTNYQNESQLDDVFDEVALSRKEYIAQVHLAMVSREII